VELKFKGNPLLEGKRTLLLNDVSMFGLLLVIRLLDQIISDCRWTCICCKTASDCQDWTANLPQQQSCECTVTHILICFIPHLFLPSTSNSSTPFYLWYHGNVNIMHRSLTENGSWQSGTTLSDMLPSGSARRWMR